MEEQKRFLSWQPVIVYYLLAVGISGPFFYWRTILDWEGFSGPGILKTMSYMWGPGIAGLICFAIYKNRFRKEISIGGRSWWMSILIWVVPFLVLAAFGLRSQVLAPDHLTPVYLIGLGFLTIWGEEFGWRWFLQDYLKPMPPIKKYILPTGHVCRGRCDGADVRGVCVSDKSQAPITRKRTAYCRRRTCIREAGRTHGLCGVWSHLIRSLPAV